MIEVFAAWIFLTFCFAQLCLPGSFTRPGNAGKHRNRGR